jgi:MFS transporter, DHA2 family, methylenomycin A resistance protein
VALSAGPIIGGVLIAGVGWHSTFFINVPIGAVGLYLTRRYATETDLGNRRIDVSGQLAAGLAMTALAAGLIEGGTAGFTSPFVIAALTLAAVALPGFLAGSPCQ